MLQTHRFGLNGRAALRCAVVCAAFVAAASGAARAENFFEFLFGGFQRSPPPQANSYADPNAAASSESVRQGAGSGHGVAFCVRLCDGGHFPIENIPNATPVETCRAMCPASKTKVFFGSEIDHATARDGQRYAELDNAFVYRKHLVANCTCNGRNALGLAPFEMANDPTLRPGDMIATEKGFVAYTGGRGAVAAFTPVDPASIANELNSVTSPTRLSRNMDAQLEDEQRTIVRRQAAPPPPSPPPSPIVDWSGH